MQILRYEKTPGVSVADLYPKKPKQPKEQTLIKRDPLFVIIASYAGLTPEQAAIIHDYEPQKNQAQYK